MAISSVPANTGGGGGGGTVTSVGLTLPTDIFDVTGSPVTGSGSLTATLDTQDAGEVFAGPATGAAATPNFRALAATDIPLISTRQNLQDFRTVITSGTVVTVNPDASVSNPMSFRIGNNVNDYPGPVTFTITGGSDSGTVSIYVAPSGVITLTHALSMTIVASSGGSVVTGSFSFPVDSTAVSRVTILSGVWGNVTDWRAWFSSGKTISANTNVSVADTGTAVTISGRALENISGSLTVPGQLNATGTPDSTTFLRGDGVWGTPPGSGTFPSTGLFQRDVNFTASYTNNNGDYAYSGAALGTAILAPSSTFPLSALGWSSGAGGGSVYIPQDVFTGFGVFSGATPNSWVVQAVFGRQNTGGDLYVGWNENVSSTTNWNNSFGVRWNSSAAQWELYVLSGGVLSGTPVLLSSVNDTNLHTFLLTSNGANSFTGSFDGGGSVTMSTGTIPVVTAYHFVMGSPIASTQFYTGRVQIQITY